MMICLEDVQQKSKPFNIPENYFDHFENTIHSRIRQQKLIQKQILKNRLKKWITVSSIAASLLIAFGLFQFFFDPVSLPSLTAKQETSATTSFLSYADSLQKNFLTAESAYSLENTLSDTTDDDFWEIPKTVWKHMDPDLEEYVYAYQVEENLYAELYESDFDF